MDSNQKGLCKWSQPDSSGGYLHFENNMSSYWEQLNYKTHQEQISPNTKFKFDRITKIQLIT